MHEAMSSYILLMGQLCNLIHEVLNLVHEVLSLIHEVLNLIHEVLTLINRQANHFAFLALACTPASLVFDSFI